MDIPAAANILFLGPRGCGKTYAQMALLKEEGRPHSGYLSTTNTYTKREWRDFVHENGRDILRAVSASLRNVLIRDLRNIVRSYVSDWKIRNYDRKHVADTVSRLRFVVCSPGKKDDVREQLLYSRHNNTLVLYEAQYFADVLPVVRSSFDYVVVWHGTDTRKLRDWFPELAAIPVPSRRYECVVLRVSDRALFSKVF